MYVKKTCHTCTHWAPVDPSLDAGMRIFGTCRQIGDYRAISERARHLAGGDMNRHREQMKLDLKKATACVQATDPYEGVDRPYLRTGMDFSCNLWEGKPEDAPKEPSLTGK